MPPLIVGANEPEPYSNRYILYAHGVTVREETQTLVVPKNLRVVFFYDPDIADTEVVTCKAGMTTLCATASNQKRWVYEPGEHLIRSIYVLFSQEASGDAAEYHFFGLYKCNDNGPVTRQSTPKKPSYDRIHRSYLIPLSEAIPFALFNNANPEKLTTLYISTCNTRPTLRGTPNLVPFLAQREIEEARKRGLSVLEYAEEVSAAAKGSSRLKRRSRTLRRLPLRRVRGARRSMRSKYRRTRYTQRYQPLLPR